MSIVETSRRLLARFVAGKDVPPQISFATTERGRLVDSGTIVNDCWMDGDASGVYRIASLTKSFTAAAILRLRDEERIALDDPADSYLTEMRTWDNPPSLRHLLTMSSGLPSDNPWADRLQDMSTSVFGSVLAGGPPQLSGPRGDFEYSNLGYAIVGRVIAQVTGEEYDRVITQWFLEPLRMTASTFHPETVGSDLVTGMVRDESRWNSEPVVAHGAFSPMGGLLSTATDLAEWAVFLAEGFAGEESRSDILSSSSRREMQTVQIVNRQVVRQLAAGTHPESIATGYGFGLRVGLSPDTGIFAGHTGGYPGFGAHMWWHSASGTGMVILANATYCPVWEVGIPAVETSVTKNGSGRIPARLQWLREQTDRLVDSWDEHIARELLSPNVCQDQPSLAQDLSQANSQHGPFGPTTDTESDGPAHVRWRREGKGASLALEILASPEALSRVQQLTFAAVPNVDQLKQEALDRLIAAMDGQNTDWPLAVATTVDTGAGKALALTSLAYGPVRRIRIDSFDGRTLVVQAASAQPGQLRLTMDFDGSVVTAFEVEWLGRAPSGFVRDP